MSKVFDAAQSDLSGLTGRPAAELQAWILEIVHRAFIDVSEEGTEAAAATAVVIGTRIGARLRRCRNSTSTGRSCFTWSTTRAARSCSRAALPIRGPERNARLAFIR